MKTSKVALLAVLAGSATAFAAPREAQTFAGPYEAYAPLADALNTTLNKNFTVSGYTPAGIRISSSILLNAVGTYGADISVRATAPSGEVYTFAISGDFGVAQAGDTVNGLIVYAFAPAAPVNPVGNWTFLVGDTFLDGTAGVSEATVSNLTIALEDNVPPATLASVNMTTNGTRTDAIAASNDVTWYLVTVPAATSPQFFEVFTGGDLLDAEMGLYSTTGARLDVDFDDGDDFNAALSFGAGSGLPMGLTNGANGNGQDGVLAAGSYYLGVYAGEGGWYPGLWFVEPITNGGAGNLSLTWRSGTRTVVLPPATALGTNPNTSEVITTGPKWYTFTANNIAVASSSFLDIATSAGLEDDTEIGVYRPDGTFVASDDDSGPGFLSLLSWGVGAGPGSLTGGLGATGASLANGQYYLVAGSYNMDFGTQFFGVSGGSGDDFTLQVASGTRTVVQPTPVTDLGTDPNSTQAVATGPQWFRFTSSDVGAFSGRFLDIATTQTGIEDDTEIGLYRNSGQLVVSNDDGGPGFLSLLSFGSGAGLASPTGGTGQNGGLGAGVYWLVAGSYNMTFTNGFGITGGPGDDFSVVFAAGTGTAPGGTPPATIANLGTLGNSTITTTATLAPATINWYQFTTPAVASTTTGRFVDVWTEAAPTTPLASGDTEIGVYSANGFFVTDDDDGAGFFGYSATSFGGGADRPASGDGVVFNGRDGTMPAGTYYVAVGEWDCEFAPAFVVTGDGEGTGNVLLKVASNFQPVITPCGPSDIAGSAGLGADGELTADDIIAFIGAFTAGNLAIADIAGSGGPTPDGELTADDIIRFINRFTAFTQSGCP